MLRRRCIYLKNVYRQCMWNVAKNGKFGVRKWIWILFSLRSRLRRLDLLKVSERLFLRSVPFAKIRLTRCAIVICAYEASMHVIQDGTEKEDERKTELLKPGAITLCTGYPGLKIAFSKRNNANLYFQMTFLFLWKASLLEDPAATSATIQNSCSCLCEPRTPINSSMHIIKSIQNWQTSDGLFETTTQK